jgi:hypothetical protein
MKNWYAPGEVITHQMSDEERQMYAEKKRKRYPWETKEINATWTRITSARTVHRSSCGKGSEEKWK